MNKRIKIKSSMKKTLQHLKESKELEIKKLGSHFAVEGLKGEIKLIEHNHFQIQIGSQLFKGSYLKQKDWVEFHCDLGHYRFNLPLALGSHEESGGSEDLKAPMPGKVLKVLVKSGQKVEAGEKLLVLEAMKMEHAIVCPEAGVVKEFCFAEGERVGMGEELVVLE